MHAFICTGCGVQYEPSNSPPLACTVCEDERQYVNPEGQSWTTLEQVNMRHKNVVEQITPGTFAIYSTPSFAIEQRAHLILSASGNILWDCITNIDGSTIALVNALGGIKAIAISHPHYFSSLVDWSNAFGKAPVYVHVSDAGWLQRKSPAIECWKNDECDLWDGIKLVRCGGHFPGSSILYNPEGSGSIFTGDTLQVSPDRRTVSFMYSYPNLVPLPKKDILKIQQSVAGLRYAAVYGAFRHYIKENGKSCVEHSIDRYLKVFE